MSGTFTMEEIAKHNTENDCWVIIDNKVYDVTTFLEDHPGGKRAILMYAGKDATKEFKMLHTKNILKKYASGLFRGTVAASTNTFTTQEIAKHNTENDCWVIIDNKVYDVTTFLEDHPGGKRAILMYAGKDATKEFKMLHTKNILKKYATGLFRGMVAGMKMHRTGSTPALTPSEVAKHNTKEDCWVIIENHVYNVTDFLEDHPGGKRAILMYAGKDATKEFKMLHNKSILKKYGGDLYLGPLVGGRVGKIVECSKL